MVEEYKGKRLVNASARSRPTSGCRGRDADAGDTVQRISRPRPDTPDRPRVPRAGPRRHRQRTAVKSSIDAQLTAHSITSNNEMMELVSDIGAGNNAWAVGRFDAARRPGQLPEQIRQPDSRGQDVCRGMAHIDGGVTGTLRAEARDDQAAENLRQVVRGFLALARMQAQADPRTTALVESLQLSGTGKTVALSFTVPPEIFQMIPKANAHPGPEPVTEYRYGRRTFDEGWWRDATGPFLLLPARVRFLRPCATWSSSTAR